MAEEKKMVRNSNIREEKREESE
jgi:hypothetical protein